MRVKQIIIVEVRVFEKLVIMHESGGTPSPQENNIKTAYIIGKDFRTAPYTD